MGKTWQERAKVLAAFIAVYLVWGSTYFAIKVAVAKQLHASNSTKIKDICHTLHIAKATLYRYLKM